MLNLDIFSIRNAKGVPSLCNLKLKQYSILYIQTLHNNCSHMEQSDLGLHCLSKSLLKHFSCQQKQMAFVVIGA